MTPAASIVTHCSGNLSSLALMLPLCISYVRNWIEKLLLISVNYCCTVFDNDDRGRLFR